MIRLRGKVALGKSPKEVSAFLADLANETKWQKGVVHVQLLGGTPGKTGSKWERVQEVSGKNIKTTTELVEATPGQLVAFQAEGKVIKYRLDYTMVPASAGTELEMRLEGEMLGFASMFEGMAAEALEKEVPANLERLKAALGG